MNRFGRRYLLLYELPVAALAWCLMFSQISGQSLPPAQAAQASVNQSAAPEGLTGADTVPNYGPLETTDAELLAVPVQTLGKRLPVQVGATIGGYFDDNIYLRGPGVSKEDDFIWSVSPLVGWNSATLTGARNSVQLAYAPTLIFYQEHPSNDFVDQAVNAVYAYEGDRIKILVSEAFSEFQEDDADFSDLVNETSSVTGVTVNYQATAKTNLAISAHQIYTSDSPGFTSIEWTGAAYLDYDVTAKTSIGIGGVVGAVDLDGPNQTYQQLNGRITYDPDPKLSFSLTGGGELRQTQGHGGQQIDPDFAGAVAYMPFDGTNLGLSAYRHYEYSNRLFGQDYLSTGVSASVSQRFFHRFFFTIAGVFENAQYQDNFTVTTTAANYDYFSIRPGLEFAPREGWDLKIFYQFRQSMAEGGVTAFTDDEVGFSASFLY